MDYSSRTVIIKLGFDSLAVYFLICFLLGFLPSLKNHLSI